MFAGTLLCETNFFSYYFPSDWRSKFEKFFYYSTSRRFLEPTETSIFFAFFSPRFPKNGNSPESGESLFCLFFLDSNASDSGDADYTEEQPKKKQKKASKKSSKKKDLNDDDQVVSVADDDVNEDEAYNDYPPGKSNTFFLIIFS